ncbi:DeoR/GlpR family DNA-binding transcription regulator [Nisaea acidiphila]|uniref:DeoR/GlpR family DNA-binding transcription regulator n=1 Tax=Nisaea acidiphila TaxID=1862145 RepID=A0A9J7AWS8_9PROT|nr:DeoR/GlpR family DNA-binding transcription regulator [Nisaea acidiphila]UUX49901.1 DeoR/GlpR family DNA-binding transcription regulator [Nisaea acidiphila]
MAASISSNASRRRAEITEMVRAAGYQSIIDLAERFAVTEQTIRRDVNQLCDGGLLRRRHGGVELPSPNANIDFDQRMILNAGAKARIAAAVASRIPDGASLAVSIGTTPEMVVRALRSHTGLRIVTNNIAAALTASASPTFEVTIAGGRIRPEGRDVLGQQVEQFFSAYKVDYGLFGVGGVDPDGSLLDFTEDEIRAREVISQNCRTKVVVLDHTKFGRAAYVRGGHIADADLVFCDVQPPAEISEMIRDAGHELIIAGDDAAALALLPGMAEAGE